MFTFTLLHSAISDDAEDLYWNNSAWNHGIYEILAQLHILSSIITYEKRIQSVEGSNTIDKIKQPMEDLVTESSANVQFTLQGKQHSWSLTESLIITQIMPA